jgi:hypothetical protein
MTTDQVKPPRRIAVALDASEQSLRVMGLAADIAAALQAELEGVFVEDSEMLRAVGLPFQREFRLASRGESVIEPERLQRELRAAARWMRQSLEQSAQRLGCSWSFRVWRGDLQAEILSAASGAEMFTLSRIGRFAPFRAPLPLRTGSGVVGMPGAAAPAALTVSLLFDGSAAARRTLAAAAELAASGRAELHVILRGADADELSERRQLALELLGDAGERVKFIALEGGDAGDLAAAMLRSGGDAFLIDAGNRLLQRGSLWQSLAALDCPMLVVS